MSKELVAILALLVTLGGSLFAFGMRIGALTTQVASMTKQLDLQAADLKAINAHFIAWAGSHREPAPSTPRGR
jgi:hypothetical protein